MNGTKPNKGDKHISRNLLVEDKFLTEKQCRLIEYNFAVKRSLGFTESWQEELSHQRTNCRDSETELPVDK